MNECRLRRADGSVSTHPFALGPATIGRGATANLRIDDEFISRVHCEAFPRDNQIVVRDLNSRNGTFVNGIRVEEAALATGDKLQLGQTNLIFQLNVQMIPPQIATDPPKHEINAVFRVVPEEPPRVNPSATVLIPAPQTFSSDT